MIYTINMPVPCLVGEEEKMKNNEKMLIVTLEGWLYDSHIYVICLLLPYTGNTAYKMQVSIQILGRKNLQLHLLLILALRDWPYPSYNYVLGPFYLTRSTRPKAVSDPANLRKEKFTTVYYFYNMHNQHT